MLTTSGLAETAALVGDGTRANMLLALMDGRALTASELAAAGGVMPQTGSAHLSRMITAGLLSVERQGRHRYYKLASPAVAHMLENVMAVAATAPDSGGRRLRTGPKDHAMRHARTCYDHLAGQLAVAMADQMVARAHIEMSPDGGAVTESGSAFLRTIGVDLDAALARSRRTRLFCRPCLDWSERRPHIAGALGSALLSACLSQDWLQRVGGSRAVRVTPPGRQALDRAFAFDAMVWGGE